MIKKIINFLNWPFEKYDESKKKNYFDGLKDERRKSRYMSDGEYMILVENKQLREFKKMLEKRGII